MKPRNRFYDPKISPEELSPAMNFIYAGLKAMPRTLGDREGSAIVSDLMSLAIRARMQFKTSDGELLDKEGFNSCVGVFRPMDERYYTEACVNGGTYARMWESFYGRKPWTAPEVLFRSQNFREASSNRVAPGLCVLLAADSAKPDGLCKIADKELWWCTSFAEEHIILCRYAPSKMDGWLNQYGNAGKPVKRRKFSREEWDALWVEAPQAEVA